MATIFAALYEIHPVMPAFYLALLANGVAAPGLYCVVKGIPLDISRIWNLARQGNGGARYAVGSWVVFALASALLLLVLLLQRFV
jgi:hypothetical protein